MLYEFLTDNRTDLIARCRAKVAQRRAPRATLVELEHGVPRFLTQLTEMLPGADLASNLLPGREAAGAESRLRKSAARHGEELFNHEFSVEQVVHDYGDVCQSITELAIERSAPITVHEFGVLNIKLDNAIAAAVTEYEAQSQRAVSKSSTEAANERLGDLAHEIRNLLNTAILAVSAIKRGHVGFTGATAAALDRSLIGIRGLIDRTLAEVRLENGFQPSREVFDVGDFIAEVQVAASLEAAQRDCDLTVSPVEPGLLIKADRHTLAAAVGNLLQNAFTFTKRGGHIELSAYEAGGRVLIEVRDECGGLPKELSGSAFRPFAQHGPDRAVVGLGLTISRDAVLANGGTLSAANIPGTGCVFTIDVPREMPQG
ncbi:MAG TPA: HAMP domain-containing sensor histidine kinase [Usitatibacter sp.]|nr:HAMP domain-containing sensor histidine kinase [Usitatibacter sp.]